MSISASLLLNEQITVPEVRVVSATGEQLGIMSIKDAQAKAHSMDMDLVMIAPMAAPPVCRVIDYGKFKYEQSRKEKEVRKKQKVTEIKEIRITPNIDKNDLETKLKAARKFLEKSAKVKVTMRFRGREITHMNNARHILDEVAQALGDISVVEKPSKVEGRSLTMFLTEKKS